MKGLDTTLIYEQINYKLMTEKGYRYPPVKIQSMVRPLSDEDFIFENLEDFT